MENESGVKPPHSKGHAHNASKAKLQWLPFRQPERGFQWWSARRVRANIGVHDSLASSAS